MTNWTPKRIAVGSRWRGFSNPHRVLCALLASLQILLPSLVAALPSDGSVVGGHADIQQVDSKHLNIQQVTDKAILNWKSFSIAADEGVRFVQPSVTSIALNRVVGTDPSVILGHLQSNGRIFLINPNGILFGAGAQIDVGGLLATTLQIRNDDFMAGRYLFAQDPLKGMHSVINRGTIQVSDHGYVFLVAPGVSNEGVIIANLGKVLLGSGQKLTVDLMGDGLIKYALSGKVLDQVMSADGKPLSSAVSNSGTIQADGGHVILQAKAAGDIFSSVLNQSGVIRARSLVNQEGIVRLDGGDSGLVQVAGIITASGLSTGQKGGQVSVIGESVALREMAKIDVSGDVGGGTALIGGNYQGLGPEPNATSTFMAAGASIASDAVTNGDGGKVIVWADGHTDFAGSISAKGGQLGGNGGFVEVSGKNTLGFAGQVNTSAPLGQTGTLLLDPTNITISTGANANIVGLLTGPVFTGAALTSTLNVATLQNALAVNNVTVDTASAFGSAGNITVSNAVTWASANSLTLQANNNINVNAGITATGAGAIRLFAGGSVNSAAAGVLTTASGGVTIQSVGASTLAGNVALGSGTLSVSNAGAMTISSIVSGTGGLTKTGAGTLTLSGNNTYIGVTNINVGILTLGAANRIANTNDVTVAGGATFNLNNFAETIGSLSGAGNVTLGTGTMTTGGNNGTTTYSGIMSGTGGLAKAGTGVFTLSGANTYTGATTINAGTLQLGAAERIANTSAVTVAWGATFNLNNFVETIGSLSGAGNVTLGSGTLTAGGNNTSTTYSGIMSGTGGLTKAGTGVLTLSGANTYTGASAVNAGTVTLGSANRIADTSAVIMNAGTFNLAGFVETIGSLSGAGNVTLGAGTLTTGDVTNTTFSGVISGTGGLTKQGTGIFTLSGANTYTGATTINAGTLQLGAADRIANTSAVTVAGGATFNLNNFNETIGSLAGAGNAIVGSGTLTAGGNNSSTTYSGIISGTGGLTKAGTGVFTLSGANGYTGATTINAGMLRVAGGAAIADTSAVTLANAAGAALDLNGTNETIGSLAGGGAAGGNITLGAGTLTTGGNNGTTTYGGIMSGTGGLTKAGTGTFTLSRANTYSGVTNVNAGTLIAAVNNALGTVAGGTTVANGATLGFSGGINYATAEPVTLNNGAMLSNAAGNNTFAGPLTLGAGTETVTTAAGTTLTANGIISGAGALTKTGTGTLVYGGANTYTGTTTVNAGTLQLGAANRIADTNAITVASGATFNLNGFAERIGSLSGGGNVTLGAGTLTTGDATLTTFSGIISGTGGLTKQGTGIFTLSGANTYTGATTINAGTLQVVGGAAIADTSSVTLANVAGATLDLNGTNETIGSLAGGGALGGNVALGTGVLTTGGNNGTTAYTGIISGTGGLTKAGTGVFTLSGANTYIGATTINAGTVTLGAANRIADVSAVTVTGGTTFNLNGFAETIGSLIGAGNVTLGAGTLTTGDAANTTFSGIMSGTGGLTKQGIGVFTLSGSNTYSGVTNVNAGTLVATANNALGTTAGGTTVASGATLGFSGGINYSTAEPVTVNGGTLANIAGNNIFAGPITLTANSSITVADGTALTVGGTINGGSQLNISSGTGSIDFLSAIGGTTPLSSLTANVGFISLGPVTTTGTQTYTGATTLNGNLTTTNSAITFNSPVTLGANTILDTGAGDIVFGNTLNGAFSLNANSAGTTTFGGVVGGTTALTSLTTNAVGTTAINGGSITTSGNQTYNDNVTMTQATTLTSSGGAVTFGGNATNTLAGAAMTIDAPTINLTSSTTIATIGNGTISFFTDTLNPNGASINVGTGAFALAPNVVTKTIEFGDVNTGRVTDVYYGSNFGSVTAGSVTIGRLAQTGDIFVTGVAAAPASINFVNGGTGSIMFENASYVSGGRDLGSLAGLGGISLGSSLTLGTGTLRLTTAGAIAQTAGTVTADTAGLSANTGISFAQPTNDITTVAAQTTAGNLSFTDTNGFAIGSVSATVDGFHPAITGLTASVGTITLQSGGAVTQTQRILASALSLQGSGPYQLTEAGNNVTTLAANTTGNLQYTDIDVLTVGTVGALNGITAAGDVALTTLGGGALTVSNGITTTNNGTATLTNAGLLALNADIAADGAVLQNGAGPVTTGGAGTHSINTTGDNVTINQALTLANDLLVDTNSAVLGNVTFSSTINGGQNLAINTGGATTFGGIVGGTTALTSLTTNAGGTIVINGGAVTTSGNQSYGDAVALGANTTLTGATPSFTTVAGSGFDFTLNFSGTTTINGATFTGINHFASDNGGTTQITGAFATSGSQIYTDAVTLTGATALTSSGNQAIGFNNIVDGAQALTVTTAGTTTFGGAAGGTTALTGLTINGGGTTTINGGAITTNGTQTYEAVTLGAATVLSSSAGVITVNGTINGAQNLTLNAGTGNIAMNGVVGGLTPLASLTVSNAGNVTFGGNVTTTGNLTQSAGTGTTTLNGASIGGSLALTTDSLVVAMAPVSVAAGPITLTAANTVNQNANLTASGASPISVMATGGAITLAAGATTSSGTGAINYTAGTNVTLGSLTTGGGVNVIANGGSVLSAAGSGTNVTAGTNSTAQAFNGVVGTQAAPLTVNVNSGTLSIRATTAVAGISAFLTGTVFPSNALILLNAPPGLVCFNGCPVPPSNNPLGGFFGLIPSFSRHSVVPWYLQDSSNPPLVSVVSTYVPGTVVAEAKTDVKSDDRSVARAIPPCFPESACRPGASILTAPADGEDPELPTVR